jgi:ribonuclease BN (tRNA processing enzyme)
MRLLFLGTAGGRRVTFYQLRASGGILIETKEAMVHLDPGPGALVRLVECGKDPSALDMILVTHRHLDHSADLNTMVEARTMGGWTKGGMVVAPADVLEGEDPLLLRYHRRHLQGVETLREGWKYQVNDLHLRVAMRHPHHGVETYGLILEYNGIRVGYITDGRYHPRMGEAYSNCHLLIVSTTFFHPREMDHLSVPEVVEIVKAAQPKQVILTHFSMEMLDHNPHKAADIVSEKTGIPTSSANDFDKLFFDPSQQLFRSGRRESEVKERRPHSE